MDDLQAEHWRVVAGGATVISTSPEQLWQNAMEYFRWCDEHPIITKRTLTSGKTQGEKVKVEFVRPYTIKAWCLHCGISERWISDMKLTQPADSIWMQVIEKILMIIYNQNLEGGLVDLYNPIMVSKVLNLDKGDETNDRPPRVEIVDDNEKQLATSENDVLKLLDSEKLDLLKGKSEKAKGENAKEE